MSASPFASCLRAIWRAPFVAALLASPVLAQGQPPSSVAGKPAAHQPAPAAKPAQPKPAAKASPAGQASHPAAHPAQKSAAGKHGPAKAAGAAAGAAAVTPPAAPKPPEPQAAPEKPPEPPKGTATGLPLPRFAALRSDEVNMRAGPGTRYPIDWVYKRRELPVEIQREFEVWRLVRIRTDQGLGASGDADRTPQLHRDRRHATLRREAQTTRPRSRC